MQLDLQRGPRRRSHAFRNKIDAIAAFSSDFRGNHGEAPCEIDTFQNTRVTQATAKIRIDIPSKIDQQIRPAYKNSGPAKTVHAMKSGLGLRLSSPCSLRPRPCHLQARLFHYPFRNRVKRLLAGNETLSANNRWVLEVGFGLR